LAILTIDLQDGYDNDEVVILINGEERYRNGSLRTDYAIGLAQSIQLGVPEGALQLRVNIPTRKLIADRPLDIAADVFVGVSLLNDAISFRVSEERFSYF
jgi:hypothetical protein